MASEFSYGFRIVGDCRNKRRLVDWQAAFHGHAVCDERAEVNREAYLSAFTFGQEFREHLARRGTTKGYVGPCFATWIWFDIDREDDVEAATRDARRLSAAMVERFAIDSEALLIFFSGSKGYHIGLPSSLWEAQPSDEFAQVARRFAEQFARSVGVKIDTGVYDRVRAFRAPNSRHPKTSRYKRHLEFQELLYVSTAAIIERAATPEEFNTPNVPPKCDAAIVAWQRAAEEYRQQVYAVQQHRTDSSAQLNRQTLEFIREGADVGHRHRLLFSAAANLAEFGCPPALAHALLTESARDCGLPPNEIRRQIDCGLCHAATKAEVAKEVA